MQGVMALRQLRVIDAVSMAQKLVRLHLGIQPGEQVLLVTDPLTEMEMAWALAGAIQDVGAEYTLTVMPTRHMERATELTKILDAGLQAADVIIGMNGWHRARPRIRRPSRSSWRRSASGPCPW